MWFNTNTAFQPKKERALRKKNTSMERADPGKISPVIYASLFVSILTNVVFAVRLYFPQAPETLREMLERPPVIERGDHTQGNRSAKITVITYMDYQCPYCAILYPKLRTLAKQDKIIWAYRQFPLKGHPYALMASKAAECADIQGKFWDYSDKIYALKGNLDRNVFFRIAKVLNLDLPSFRSCLHSAQTLPRIRTQVHDGKTRHITGTPTFYINGKRINGLVPDKALLSLLKPVT